LFPELIIYVSAAFPKLLKMGGFH